MSPSIAMPSHRILIPLAVDAFAIASTVIVHAIALTATVQFVRRQRRPGHAGASFWMDVAIVAVADHIRAGRPSD